MFVYENIFGRTILEMGLIDKLRNYADKHRRDLKFHVRNRIFCKFRRSWE